jgi:hypothetical protein
MTRVQGAVLVAEVGSLITRVTLIDQVDGESRMVGHAETASTVEAPFGNALFGILEAAAQISELTGRQMLSEGQLIMPQNSEQDGVNQLVVTTSAAGTISLVVVAIAADTSARSAVHASRATYSALLQVVTLDDAAGQPALGPVERSWIERQVERLLSLHPDAVLIAGGLEHGAVRAVNRLAHIVGLTAISTGVDASGQQRQELTARPVIYAGNSDAREHVISALSDRAELFIIDNLRPALDQANLDPTRQELTRLYEKQILPRLAGIGNLRRLSPTPIRTVCEVEGMMTRFLAERTGRRVLVVDAGASASAAFYAAPGRYHPAVLGTTGTGFGLTALLAHPGLAAISRWLPFPISEAALTERLLNKALRPQMLPSSREEIYIDHALACEALRASYAALSDETGAIADFDWLVAGGGVLAHAPAPGLALLTLLNAIQPTGESEHPVVDVYLDTLGLLVAGGALSGLDPEAAITMIDRDLLRSVPLASVVTLLGAGRPGEPAAEIELTLVNGASQRVKVAHGDLVRLELPMGRYGQVQVSPASGVRVGMAAPGEVVVSPGAELVGSALGLVIDARERPLRLPDDPVQRCTLLWRWLVALEVEHGPSPYVNAPVETSAPIVASPPAAMPAPVEPVPPPPAPVEPVPPPPAPVEPVAAPVGTDEVVDSPAKGKRISLDDLKNQEQAAPAEPPPAIESDLDALRQTVETPKQRGWFGRKK